MSDERQRAVKKARHIANLANDPSATADEKSTARATLKKICAKYEIAESELAPRRRSGFKLYREIERSLGTELAGKIYESFAIDAILDSIVDDRSRDLIDSSLARVVEFISGKRG